MKINAAAYADTVKIAYRNLSTILSKYIKVGKAADEEKDKC